MKKSKFNQKGSIILVALVVVVILVVGGIFLWNQFGPSRTPSVDPLPPVEDRINPAPLSGNEIVIDEVNPGNQVFVSEAKLVQSGYLAVKNDDGSTLGRSELLEAGEHKNIVITTSVAMGDGYVVYVVLEDANRTEVKDSFENTIQVQKNVGMVMSHYEDEY